MGTRSLIFQYVSLFVLAAVMGAGLVPARRRFRQRHATRQGRLDSSLLQQKKPTTTWLHQSLEWLQILARHIYHHRQTIVELAILAAWALWVGRAYLNFDPNLVPAGREYGSAIQGHHLWTRIKQCGLCALWNGGGRGGVPACVDPYGSMLHPLVIIATLVWGVVNGSKFILIVALWVAGVAQWWLARALRLGWSARIWSGLIAVAGGHLAGRMELGLFGIVLSTATCSLVFAPALVVARSGSRRATVLLGAALALTLVAGQGYVQIGLLFLSPALLFLILGDGMRLRTVWREYAIAIGLALLLAAPFLVPLVHFWPNLAKEMDPSFGSAQPLRYFVLNLVIDDFEILASDLMHKMPQVASYSMYIGWVPILLAALCLKFAHREDYRALLFLGVSAVLALWTGSAVPLRWLQPVLPSLASARFPTLIGGLAIPPILGLAAYGLDKLLAVNWPRLVLGLLASQSQHRGIISLKWTLLIPLVWSVYTCYDFSHGWLYVVKPGDVDDLLQALRTPSLQWVAPPFGEHFFIEPAIRMDLKLSPGIMTWSWKDRPFPEPYLEIFRGEPPLGATLAATVNEISVYRFEGRDYAFVQTNGEMIQCSASGIGGDLLVECSTREAGTLVVRENSWTGWYAWRDQKRVPLLDGRWLSVDAPAGKYRYRFRYLPWDVPLGMLLWMLGVGLCIWQWCGMVDNSNTSAECPQMA